MISEPFIGDEPFVMYLGDNLLNKGIVPFVRGVRARAARRADPADARCPTRRCSASPSCDDGRVVRLVEKPKEPISDLALVGVYMFGPEIFESVDRIKPSFRNELEITDAIQDLIDRGLTVRPHIVEGWWKDTGQARGHARGQPARSSTRSSAASTGRSTPRAASRAKS